MFRYFCKEIYRRISRHLSKGYNDLNIFTRPQASNGFRLCFYLFLCLPSAVPLLLLPTISFLLFPPRWGRISPTRFLVDCITLTITYLTLGINLDHGFSFGVTSTVTFGLLYPHLMLFALQSCPGSFTIGEASIVVQGIMMFIYKSLVNIYISASLTPFTDYDIITLILQMGLLFVLLVVWTLYRLSPYVDFNTFACVVCSYLSLLVVLLHGLLWQSPLLWMMTFFLKTPNRLALILFWFLFIFFGIVAVFHQIFSGVKATTSNRKVFHALCSMVYFTGYMWDIHLIYLSSGLAVACLIATEAVRKLDFRPVSIFLNEGFKLFADEKDADISLTPIYLLVGLALPLALSAPHGTSVLPYIAGLLSVGVGDAFASYIGSNFGETRWHSTSKSVEGTVASIISQLFVVCVLLHFGYIYEDQWTLGLCVLAIVANAIEEAVTDQVDNLTLPMITYSILQFC